MIRSKLTKRITEYLQAAYSGPISIQRETGDADLSPPYAVLRVGGAENMFPGQAEFWNVTVLCSVNQDADSTSVDTAEILAAEVFEVLEKDEDLKQFCADSLAFSAWERNLTEFQIADTNWQHVAGFTAIVSPLD